MREVDLPQRRWTSGKRATYQRPDGRYDRTRLAPMIVGYRRKGWTLPQIAEHTGIPQAVIHSCSSTIRSLQLIEEEGTVRLTELVQALGVRADNMRQRAAKLDVPVFYVGRFLATTDRGAERLMAYYGERLTAKEAATWWSSVQAAQTLGMTNDAFVMRVKAGKAPFDLVRRKRVLGMEGNLWRYDPDSIRAVAAQRPIAPHKPPMGTLTSLQVVQLLGLSRSAPKLWAARGAPHGRTSKGRGNFYFYPRQLADWLERQGQPYQRSMARVLREYADRQQGRAA